MSKKETILIVDFVDYLKGRMGEEEVKKFFKRALKYYKGVTMIFLSAETTKFYYEFFDEIISVIETGKQDSYRLRIYSKTEKFLKWINFEAFGNRFKLEDD